MRQADAIEVVIGQGAKPGGGGMLLGQKINPRVAQMRTLPEGIDQRSACRHPDWTGPDDLVIKIQELREITDWEKPIYVKIGATRTFNDVKLAVHSGADVIVVDGMQGGTAATQTVFIEHVGIPTLAAVRQAVEALEDLNMLGAGAADRLRRHPHRRRRGQGAGDGRRRGLDRAGRAHRAGLQHEMYFQNGEHHSAVDDYAHLGTAPGFCHHCHTGKCPVGVTTQDAVLETAAGAGGRRAAREELSQDAQHGAHDDCARVRQAERASPRARRSGRADGRGGGDGAGAAGRDQLDSRSRVRMRRVA